jgi:hypothetical protein
MPRVSLLKTSFAAGELSTDLLGRTDLRAYENGARTLSNIFIHSTGAISRRAGLRFIQTARGAGRLIALELDIEQIYLLAFSDRAVDIFVRSEPGRLTKAAAYDTPWSEAQLQQLSWTQNASSLLIVHPDTPPKRLARNEQGDWSLSDWVTFADGDRSNCPQFKFVDSSITLNPGSPNNGIVTITASAPVFQAGHAGTRLRIEGKEVHIAQVQSPTQVKAEIKDGNLTTQATRDWTEQAWSPVRGWPASVCFHQNRLVVGGSRDLPNRLWLSRSGNAFNFDLGSGLDDQGIEFTLLSDQTDAIRHVFSGRHLQVFTSGAEWMVTGEPLTPSNIQLHRQTRVGSPVDRTVPPRAVDGATLFVSRTGKQLYEFLFADTEQAYQANDLALLAHHLMQRPIDMDFDKARRLFHVVMSDGTLATVTIYRAEGVTAWTQQQTMGAFRAVAAAGDDVFVLAERANGWSIEAFDPSLQVDSALTGEAPEPTVRWGGADHLEGETVKLIADGVPTGEAQVSNGEIALTEAAGRLVLGLPYTHVVEPLASAPSASNGGGYRIRPVAITFRLWETPSLKLDTGRGPEEVPFHRLGQDAMPAHGKAFSGDKTVRVLGWRNSGMTSFWRIEQDNPTPFMLLSVATELSVI